MHHIPDMKFLHENWIEDILPMNTDDAYQFLVDIVWDIPGVQQFLPILRQAIALSYVEALKCPFNDIIYTSREFSSQSYNINIHNIFG